MMHLDRCGNSIPLHHESPLRRTHYFNRNSGDEAQTCREVTRFQQPADNPGWRQWAKSAAHFASLWVDGLEHLIGSFEQHT
jgi:hypothetical protein